MNEPNPDPPRPPARWVLALAGLLLVGALAATYGRSFDGPFFFDDTTVLRNNPHMTSLWPPVEAMRWPPKSSFSGRPLPAYSLAVNYAVSGTEVWSYRVFNLLVHTGNALLLWAVLHRTLLRPALGWLGPRAAAAWAVALLWAVHPLNSEVVLYMTQRNVSMCAFFCLLAVLLLSVTAGRERQAIGQAATVFVVGMGVLCKEFALVMPVVLLLYDRALLAGSFAKAWRQRGWMYVGSAVFCGCLAAFTLLAVDRGGISDDPADVWWYLLTQGGVILKYVRLVFWPDALAITHDLRLVDGFVASLPGSVIVFAGLVATGWALVKRPVWGAAGACFYLWLSPDSSVVPILTEVEADRRMYLPSAVVLVLAGLGVAWLLGRAVRERPAGRRAAGALLALLLPVAAGGAVWTHLRTHDFDDTESLWVATLEVEPNSPMALNNLATLYLHQRRLDEALPLIERQERMNPDYKLTPRVRGMYHMFAGEYELANPYLIRAAESSPSAPTLGYLSLSLGMSGRFEEAVPYMQRALELDPDSPLNRTYLALMLDRQGNAQEAVAVLEELLAEAPGFGPAGANLGVILDRLGRHDEARARYEKTLELNPGSLIALRNFASFTGSQGDWPKTRELYGQVLQQLPDDVKANNGQMIALRNLGEFAAAQRIADHLLRIAPDDPVSHNNIGILQVHRDRKDAALAHFRRAVELDPTFADAAANLARIERLLAPPPESSPELDAEPGDG
ncbi:MAG: tetratricopeptide repeat protein [Planctomycetota bacterium]